MVIADCVGLRVEDRQFVSRIFWRTHQSAIGVDGWVALVGRDQVVQVFVRLAPAPFGDDEVAFDALWPRRLFARQLAGGDRVGPLAEILEGYATQRGQRVDHKGRRLTR